MEMTMLTATAAERTAFLVKKLFSKYIETSFVAG